MPASADQRCGVCTFNFSFYSLRTGEPEAHLAQLYIFSRTLPCECKVSRRSLTQPCSTTPFNRCGISVCRRSAHHTTTRRGGEGMTSDTYLFKLKQDNYLILFALFPPPFPPFYFPPHTLSYHAFLSHTPAVFHTSVLQFPGGGLHQEHGTL